MKKTAIMTVLILILVGMLGQVQAMYQSSGGLTTKTSTTANDFFINIRKMESAGQVMGLNEKIDENNGNATTPSNNIDVHMLKNSEWGLMAMLSASKYGIETGNITSGTTTGNKYGIENTADGKWEYLAGINSNIGSNSSYCGKLRNAANKYRDLYINPSDSSSDYSAYISGDATKETVKWRGASNAIFVNSSYPVFCRGTYGVFNFTDSNGYVGSSIGSRAGAWCGGGL